MHITNLRKVGGSVMMAVPPVLLDLLDLKAGAAVSLAVEGEKLVVTPAPRRRWTLEAMLADTDFETGPTAEERAWLDAPRAGGELI